MHNPPLILIIDDDRQINEMFSRKFAIAGFKVITALNGKAGYEMAKTEQPDLIILDLRMPVWDGAETLDALKKDPATKNLKVIILSAFNDWSTVKMTKEAARALGVLDFFDKSVDLNELVARSRFFIEQGGGSSSR